MNTSIRFLISLCLAISIAGVNCVSPVSPTEEIPAITGINVTGKILLKDNTPIKGAKVSLLKSDLSAVTDSTGTYYITSWIWKRKRYYENSILWRNGYSGN